MLPDPAAATADDVIPAVQRAIRIRDDWTRVVRAVVEAKDRRIADCEFASGGMADALEGLLGFSRVATFDEADGEREVVAHAQAVLRRLRSRTGA